MKKSSIIISIIIALLMFTLFLTACDKDPTIVENPPLVGEQKTRLATPKVERDDVSSLTFMWDEISNATSYYFSLTLNNVKLMETTIDSEDDLEVLVSDTLLTDLGTYIASVTATDSNNLFLNSLPGTYELAVNAGAIASHPYEIYNINDLYYINNYPTYYYKLMNDIDLKDEGFIPLCTDVFFEGTFDGNNKKISNINLTIPNINDIGKYIGLFGNLYGANIYNLTIENFNSNNPGYVYLGEMNIGTLAGRSLFSTIDNVNVTSSNINWDIYRNAGHVKLIVGGLIGSLLEQNTITNCSVNSTLRGETPYNDAFYGDDSDGTENPYQYASTVLFGGLVGYAFISSDSDAGAVINQCMASGSYNFIGNNIIGGGLIGDLIIFPKSIKNRIYIENSYASASIGISEEEGYNYTEFKKRIGLLIGNSDYVVLDNCYADVSLNLSNLTISEPPQELISKEEAALLPITIGFIGYNYGSGAITDNDDRYIMPREVNNCYYNIDKLSSSILTNFTNIGGWATSFFTTNIKAVDNSDKHLEASYTEWDFDEIWQSHSDKMPTFR